MWLVLGTQVAMAKAPLEPLNRGHLGVSMSDGQTVGLAGGFDSRLTRLVFVDVGGFMSPLRFPEDGEGGPLGIGTRDLYLRHALYFSPGLRLPHGDGEALRWDLLGRFGFGAIWMVDTNQDHRFSTSGRYEIVTGPSGFGGLELAVLGAQDVGLKISAKEFVTKAYSYESQIDVVLLKPELSAEVLYQW